ncbi:putative carbonic anhydrase-like protein 2 isoform X2 [Ruditapes philippinarum]|uniref:putative carbonic anhydrase-like protein 2 isoform X2 n=1 Tax=Ruditapes philippinarum TaxID=129788 RepID=UPI00295C091B|nr:putative carbonic anhydrase-like protein 2 isoform X2 [Ruditapes philippinarum]
MDFCGRKIAIEKIWLITLIFISVFKLGATNDTVTLPPVQGSSLWSIWWNYDGISGPSMWGSMNGEWFMCSKGKNQSPIDIEPNTLLFDPSLKHIEIEGDMMSGTLINNGVDLTFEANETSLYAPVNITLGPLSYKYTISQIKFHFGSWDGMGSEHSINKQWFDGEVQVIAYNSDVYKNLSHAEKAPRGVAIIAAFLQVGKYRNRDFDVISELSRIVLYKGQRARLKHFSILSFLPNKEHYITYDGSFTQPGCYETVTWMILNRPIGVTHEQLELLRNLRQRDIQNPQSFMADNIRPLMPLNRRTVRTNINFKRGCSMEQDMHYQCT